MQLVTGFEHMGHIWVAQSQLHKLR